MLSLERIKSIVDEEVQLLDPELQQEAQQCVEDYLLNPKDPHFCTLLRARIRQLPQMHRKPARASLKHLSDRISLEAIGNAHMEAQHRRSARLMYAEQLQAYSLIQKLGRGVVYFGSARMQPGQSHYEQARILGRDVHRLLGSTSWSGAGPGLMEAPLYGAREDGGQVGGIKIILEAHECEFEQKISDVFPVGNVVSCKFFGPRKVGLIDACMRVSAADKTALVVLPGGFGTNDEFFEFLTLKQLQKLGSEHPVPVLLMNYDGFYDRMIDHLHHCVRSGTLAQKNMELFTVCNANDDAIAYLEEVYTDARS